jgi:hypothetical protein
VGLPLVLEARVFQQAEGSMDRLWRKKRKLEARLLDDWQKPKGMHWRTYKMGCQRLAAVEHAKDAEFAIRVQALLGYLDG